MSAFAVAVMVRVSDVDDGGWGCGVVRKTVQFEYWVLEGAWPCEMCVVPVRIGWGERTVIWEESERRREVVTIVLCGLGTPAPGIL